MACFEFVMFWLEIFGEKGQNASFNSNDVPPPRRTQDHLLTPVLLRLGEGMLHLDEPIFLASFALTSSLLVLLSIFIKPQRML